MCAPNHEHEGFGRRLVRLVLLAALVALVVVPAAAALRFTDSSYQVPDGAIGAQYFHRFQGDGGCGPALPYQFRVLNGGLPPGLSLGADGLVSGTPAEQGSWSFWLELSDQDPPPPTASWCQPRKSEREFTIKIGPRGSVPPASGPPSGGGSGGGGIPDPCDLPVVGNVCDAVAGAVSKVATEAGEFVMRAVTAWVTNTAVWVTGKLGELIERTTSPDLSAGWFQAQYATMLQTAGALALLMLVLATIQAVLRQDAWLLLRAAFGYLPLAFILAAVATSATGLLVALTDDLSAAVVSGLQTDQSQNLLQAIGDAYKNALEEESGIPLFGVFLGAIILALGAFVLWLEMIIRDAAIYVCLFFLPLTFIAMVWPATGRWARRLAELLIAIILAKFLIVAILSLATAALANTGLSQGEDNTFEQMLAGSALLILAAWSPFALLRMLPMMELAAANLLSQRTAISAAAGSSGLQSPSGYMRQAMSRAPSPASHSTTQGGSFSHGEPSTEPEQRRNGRASGHAQASQTPSQPPAAPEPAPAEAGRAAGGSRNGPTEQAASPAAHEPVSAGAGRSARGSQSGPAAQGALPPPSRSPRQPVPETDTAPPGAPAGPGAPTPASQPAAPPGQPPAARPAPPKPPNEGQQR